MRLLNIHNKGRTIYLFSRDEKGNQVIRKDSDFLPFYFEPGQKGEFRGYDGVPLKKIYVSEPKDIYKMRSDKSYSSDIKFVNNFIIHKIDKIEECPLKYMFVDIEILAKEFPEPSEAKYPVSCITTYNSMTKEYKTWSLSKDTEKDEIQLLTGFITYVKKEAPDLVCLDPETTINTPFGYKTIKNINIGDYLISYKSNHYIYSKVLKKHNTKNKVLKISTFCSSIKCSFSHIFPTLNFIIKDKKNTFFKNTKAENLKSGDYLLYPINTKKLSEYRDDYFWLLGYYFGDGSIGKKETKTIFEIKDANEELLLLTQKFLKKFGIKSIIRNYKTCHLLQSYSQKAYEIVERIKLLNKKGIVDFLLKLTVEHQISFLGGIIDAEGTVKFKTFGMTRKDIMDWADNLLWSVGIPHSFNLLINSHRKIKKDGYKRKPFYSIYLYDNMNNNKLYLKHPQKKEIWTRVKSKGNKKNVIPIRYFLIRLCSKWNIDNKEIKKIFWNSKNETLTRNNVFKVLEIIRGSLEIKNIYKLQFLKRLKIFVNNFHFEKITKIIKEDESHNLIEITLDKSPYFIGNNILTHNCAWHISFDYNYLFNRCNKLKINFPKSISPINQVRIGEVKDIFYPAGISVVDYLTLFKKVEMREASYALDYIGEKFLGRGKKYKNPYFGSINSEVILRNIDDVRMMVELEEQKKLLPYYDEVRRTAKVNWEDLYHNSRIIEMMLLEEAKIKNIILPNKKQNVKKISFKGATREAIGTGVFSDVGKVDLSSAYPSVIINFCLDESNISKKEGIDIDGVKFKQNSEALLPSMVKKILVLKNKLKEEKKGNPELESKYAAVKGIINSAFGVFGSPYFRLYNNNIVSSITFLVRDLLIYCKDRLEKEGHKVIFYDTDSLFYNSKEDLSDKLNQYIQDWGKKYGKDKIDLKFDYEGYFTKLFILGMCHYYGYIYGKKDPEIKGVEIKRSSSSKYEAYFQEKLLNKVLDKESKEDIVKWITEEKERIKTIPINEIAFPCKVQKKNYVNRPIFLRAYDNGKSILGNKFDVAYIELFWYLFTKGFGYDEYGKERNVLGITRDTVIDKKHINWEEMIRRSIITKAVNIFDAMDWSKLELHDSDQLGLF